jgi:hypothetical protein
MAYLGLMPSEHCSGPKRRIGAITKAGDIHARTLLIEAAHSYRFPARVARHKLAATDPNGRSMQQRPWKAQTRLCQRYRYMMAKGKLRQVVNDCKVPGRPRDHQQPHRPDTAAFGWHVFCIRPHHSIVSPDLPFFSLLGKRRLVVTVIARELAGFV